MHSVRRLSLAVAVVVAMVGLAAPSFADSVPRSLAVPAQSIIQVQAKTSWDLRAARNLAISGQRGSWAGVTVTASLKPDDYAMPGPSRHWVSRDMVCPLSGCGTARDYVESNALHVLRPGTYYVVVVAPAGRNVRVSLGGFAGRIVSVAPLRGRSQVLTCDGVGVAQHRSVLDCGYDIERPKAHVLKGYMYLAAIQGPGTEVLAECANKRTETRPLAGPNACMGFSFLLGPGANAGTGVMVDGWYSLGNIDFGGGQGDGHFYAVGTGSETHLTVMSWSVELPF